MYRIRRYGEEVMVNPYNDRENNTVLVSDGFVNLSAKKQAKMYISLFKIIANNPCEIKDAELMCVTYSNEPNGNKVAKLLDKAGVDRYDEVEKGIGIKGYDSNGVERVEHYFHMDIPFSNNKPHVFTEKIKGAMEKLMQIGGWGDYALTMTSIGNAELCIGGLFESDEYNQETALIYFDLDGNTIVEFKVDETTTSLFDGIRDIVVHDTKSLEKIIKAIKRREFTTQSEQ